MVNSAKLGKPCTDQNINALKIAKNSKTYEIFMVID